MAGGENVFNFADAAFYLNINVLKDRWAKYIKSSKRKCGAESLSSFLNACCISPQTQSSLMNNADTDSENNILNSPESSISNSFNSSQYISSLTNQIDELLLQNKTLEEKVVEENATRMSAQSQLKDITLQNEKNYKTLNEKITLLSKFNPHNFKKRLDRQLLKNKENHFKGIPR